MIRLYWGGTFPTPPLCNTNGKGGGKQTTQPLIPKQAPALLRSSAPYQGCLVSNGLEKTSGAKFSHDLHQAGERRAGNSTGSSAQSFQTLGKPFEHLDGNRGPWDAAALQGTPSALQTQRESTLSATMRVEFNASLQSFSREAVLLVWETTLNFNHNQVHKHKYRLSHHFFIHGVKFPTLETQMLRTGCLIVTVTANQCFCQSVQAGA